MAAGTIGTVISVYARTLLVETSGRCGKPLDMGRRRPARVARPRRSEIGSSGCGHAKPGYARSGSHSWPSVNKASQSSSAEEPRLAPKDRAA
jgi:hypothetical protein